MHRIWQIQEACKHLDLVVDEAIERGPQILTRQGVEIAVVLSIPDYLELKRKMPLSEFFRQPLLAELDLERDKSPITRSDLAELLDEPCESTAPQREPS